ncbi:MAG: hypothetical protein JNL01_08310 [Bdellovibrionales bacterium]|nr:hypothetical protein [Bdellovibrionales bacterium]
MPISVEGNRLEGAVERPLIEKALKRRLGLKLIRLVPKYPRTLPENCAAIVKKPIPVEEALNPGSAVLITDLNLQCQILGMLKNAQPFRKNRFKDDLSDLAVKKGFPKEALPLIKEGDRIVIVPLKGGFRIESKPQGQYAHEGQHATFKEIARADFTGNGDEEVLMFRETSLITGGASDCEVLLFVKKKVKIPTGKKDSEGKKIYKTVDRLAVEKTLPGGRCS